LSGVWRKRMSSERECEIILEVIIPDRSFRRQVEQWLCEGRFLVLNGGPRPEAAELGVIRAAVTITPRERQVLEMLERYDHDHEIAAALFISEDTVQTHLWNLKQKLGVHSRHRLL